MAGFKKTSATNTTQILFSTEPQATVGIKVANTGITADSNGKKIIKAGTPMAGSLEARGTAFTTETTTSGVSDAVGVLLHDVDVTDGTENATLLIFGFVNLNRLDTTTAALITTAVKTALNAKVTFVK